MDDVARLALKDLGALFRAAAAKRGLPEAILEKDFWVCWVLKRILGGRVSPATPRRLRADCAMIRAHPRPMIAERSPRDSTRTSRVQPMAARAALAMARPSRSRRSEKCIRAKRWTAVN